MIFQFSKKTIRWYFLTMEYHVYWLLKSSCFELSGDGKYSLFWDKKWMENDIYWLLESSCFALWKVLVLNFSQLGNTVFFWAKTLMERWYLLSLFELSKIFQDMGDMVFRAVAVIQFTKIFHSFSWRNTIYFDKRRLLRFAIYNSYEKIIYHVNL